ncbi:uncharacterized protein [Battus philenor]|uniref:uncharacterized protein n=1 Tax=Battus philenor TaxID=42288 RepID=UPI0035D11BA4
MEIKILFLLISINLFNHFFCIYARKEIQPYSKKFNVLNYSKLLSSDIRTKRDIAATFLVSGVNKKQFIIPNIGDLIKSLRIPGYNVYRVHFHDENQETGNDEKSKKLQRLYQPQSTLKSLNDTKYSFNPKANDKRLNNSSSDILKVPNSESSDINNLNVSISNNQANTGKYIEESTTNLNDVTTNGEVFDENSTVTSDYDDEEYGSILNRGNIPPDLLASLVG